MPHQSSQSHTLDRSGASTLVSRRFGFPLLALLAALAASLLFLLPGGPVHAQDADLTHPENSTDAVATFTAADPEGRPVYWSLATQEVNGEVTVEDVADHADFMINSDGVLSFKFSPDFESPMGGGVVADTNTNTYKVVVVASDDAPGAGEMIEMAYEKVTVMVTDVDEMGMVTLSAEQPQASVELTATLTDDDAIAAQVTAAKWKWEHSSAADGPWTSILTATDAAYLPLGVEDKYLRATATYTDKHDSGKTAQAVSANMVRAEPAANNAAPVFPSGADARSVDENSPPGTNVGKPVVANDGLGDVLTYTLGGIDVDEFDIDQATGQITVGARSTLDTESGGGGDASVTVRATDPFGNPNAPVVDPANSIEVIVAITINNVNEAPMMTAGLTRVDDHAEINAIDTVVSTYMADDEDAADSTLTWSTSGTDGGDFDISTTRVLTFKEIPNFEMPADANKDNVYMVTVVATDSKKATAMRDVVITVTNVNEVGAVTLSSEQPKIGIELTATLEDPDGVVADSIKWTWHSSSDGTGDAIEGATSATYTPEADGALSAKASYTDGHGSGKMAVGTKAAVVENTANVAPKFPAAETGMRVVAEGTVAGMEINDADEDNAADPVEAMDANTDDTLTYTLGGADMASFGIVRSSGQLQTKGKLDYEDKKSYMVTVTATDPNGLSADIDVTIKVTNVDEAPMIAGEDIAEDFRENGRNLEIERFRATDPEGRPVYWSLAEAEVTDKAPADDIVDHEHFMLSSGGVLSFKFSPDYEMPRGAAFLATNNTNTYKVVVVASDDAVGVTGRMMAYRKVTVTVTNVDETETVTLSAERAQVDVALTATYNDLDNERPSAAPLMWKWYLGSSEIPGETAQAHTPTTSGSLRVEASYTKTDGTIKRVSKTINVRPMPANNAPPVFPSGSEARSVDENSPPGTNVGKPVAAIDASGDVLTYTLAGIEGDDYRINQATGQITVAPRTMLNLEEPNEADSVTVTVTATDPAGETAEQIVAITINNVNEAPMMTAGLTRVDDHAEINAIDTVVSTYMADDEDAADSTLTWSTSGTDGGDFDISTTGVLTFKEIPNFEMPADANKDNVYMVTVVATDSKKATAMRDVVITVTNVNEVGAVTLSSEQPKIGIELTATLEDPDGVVADSIKWTWHSSSDGTGDAIEGATSATYTPEADGALSAKASYTDGHGSGKMAVGTKAAVVENTANVAPKFPAAETGMRVVAEGTVAGMEINDADEDNAADPVEAMDANTDDTLTYTLGGADMASFGIVRSSGQLQTKGKLDYEDKKSYMVTVTATDPNGLSADIDVTIKVTDVDEAPEITVGGLAISGIARVDYAEDRRDAVATYRASGPDATSATWSLEGVDAGDFDISISGELTFMSGPDYENAMDTNMDNTYMVTVKADDGTYMDTHEVTVRVMDVDEAIVGDALVDKYDVDNDGIEKSEVITAIRDYIRADIGDPNAISKADVIRLIRIFIRS